MSVLRTTRDGCFSLTTNYYGTYVAPVPDPLADTVITKAQMEGFELSEDIARIPSELWSRWIQLCIEMVRRNNQDLEVSCRILRSKDDPSIYRILVPVQQVTKVSVRVDSFDRAIDIETGETVEQWPPEGWSPVGSSHSHNTMEAFFSGTDDQYELGDPGLHIVVGNIDLKKLSYDIEASVTANHRRFSVPGDKVVDLESHPTATYHKNVLDAIKLSGVVIGTTANPRRTLASNYNWGDMDYDYSPAFPRKTPSLVTSEVTHVMNAVDDLIQECDIQGISPADVLQQLAFDIEDLAEAQRPASHAIDDPFYWNV